MLTSLWPPTCGSSPSVHIARTSSGENTGNGREGSWEGGVGRGEGVAERTGKSMNNCWWFVGSREIGYVCSWCGRKEGGLDMCIYTACESVTCVNGQEKGERQEQPCVEALTVSEWGFHLGKDIRTVSLAVREWMLHSGKGIVWGSVASFRNAHARYEWTTQVCESEGSHHFVLWRVGVFVLHSCPVSFILLHCENGR